MSIDASSLKVVAQLEEIIKGRYGRDLKVIRLMNFSEAQNSRIQQVGEEIHIPLSFGNLFLGKAILKGRISMDSTDMERASQTVKLALEPVLYREYLIRQEANQSAQLSKVHMDIKPGFISLLKNSESSDFEESLEELSQKSKKMDLALSLVFLEGKNPEFVRRVAYEIHEQSELWSFVQYKDLQASIKNLAELEELSLATIFIDSNDLKDPVVREWVLSLKDRKLNELIILVHKTADQMTELTEVPIIPVDRLPAHRLLRIESLQMLLSQACIS